MPFFSFASSRNKQNTRFSAPRISMCLFPHTLLRFQRFQAKSSYPFPFCSRWLMTEKAVRYWCGYQTIRFVSPEDLFASNPPFPSFLDLKQSPSVSLWSNCPCSVPKLKNPISRLLYSILQRGASQCCFLFFLLICVSSDPRKKANDAVTATNPFFWARSLARKVFSISENENRKCNHRDNNGNRDTVVETEGDFGKREYWHGQDFCSVFEQREGKQILSFEYFFVSLHQTTLPPKKPKTSSSPNSDLIEICQHSNADKNPIHNRKLFAKTEEKIGIDPFLFAKCLDAGVQTKKHTNERLPFSSKMLFLFP